MPMYFLILSSQLIALFERLWEFQDQNLTGGNRQWRWMKVYSTVPLQFTMDFLVQLRYDFLTSCLAICCHASAAIMDYPSGTLSPNTFFIYKLPLFTVFYHTSRKSTNTPLLLSNISKDTDTRQAYILEGYDFEFVSKSNPHL